MFIYQKIAEDLKTAMSSGRLPPASALPPERDLAKRYAASSTSIRKAMAILENEGLIVKRHGSGNYVNGSVAAAGPGTPVAVDTGLILALCDDVSSFRAGIAGAFQELFADLPYPVTIKTPPSAIGPEMMRGWMREYPRTPIIAVNSRNETAQLADEGLLLRLEEMPAFITRLEHHPDSLKWKFAGPNGMPSFYSCPFAYKTGCLAINDSLARAAGLDPDDPPQTWEDLQRWCAHFTDWKRAARRHDLHAAHVYADEALVTSLHSYLYMATGGRPYELQPRLDEGLRLFFNLISTLFAHGDLDVLAPQGPDPFVGGKYLFALEAGTWLPRDLAKFNPEMLCRLCRIPRPSASLPYCIAAGTQMVSLTANGSDAVGRERMRECCDLLYDFPRTEGIFRRLGALPSESTACQAYVARHPEFVPFHEALFHARECHNPRENELRDCLGRLFTGILRHREVDAETVVRRFRAELEVSPARIPEAAFAAVMS